MKKIIKNKWAGAVQSVETAVILLKFAKKHPQKALKINIQQVSWTVSNLVSYLRYRHKQHVKTYLIMDGFTVQ